MGLPVIVVEAVHMQKALSAQRNKTDRNDARGIAHMMRVGWFRQVHVKDDDNQRLRVLLSGRRLLKRKLVDIENGLRGSLKAFGIKIGGQSLQFRNARLGACRRRGTSAPRRDLRHAECPESCMG